jgi:hypothetical protein
MTQSVLAECVPVRENVLILYCFVVAVVEEQMQKRRYSDDGVSCFLTRCGSHFFPGRMGLHLLSVSYSLGDFHWPPFLL